MTPEINVEQVKAYNANLKAYKESYSKIQAEIEFNQRELQRQCAELTAELGITVTVENVQQILEERTAKILNTIQVGTDILNRIKAEEKSTNEINNQGQPFNSIQQPQMMQSSNVGTTGNGNTGNTGGGFASIGGLEGMDGIFVTDSTQLDSLPPLWGK